MWLTDMEGIAQAVLRTALIGGAAGGLIYLIFWFCIRKKEQLPLRIHLLRWLFSAYLVSLVLLTLVPSGHEADINLIPFRSLAFAVESGFETAQNLLLLNILLFVPLGVFLPLVFKKAEKIAKTVLICFGASLAIELLQLIFPLGRAFDVDDLILNTFGGALGYALYAVCRMVFIRQKIQLSEKISAFAVLAVIPVFFCTVAIVNSAKEFDDVFHFNVMIPDMELSLHVEGEYPEKAWVYQMTEDISPEERFRELAEKFDIEEAARAEREYLQAESEGRELLVSKEDAGFWRFSLRSASLAPARQDDAELTEAARNWLQSHGLWKEIFTVRRIEKEYSFSGTGEKDFYSSIDENGKETIAEGWFESGKCVVFEIAYMAAQESGTVAMHFDGDGLYQIEFSTSQYAPYKEVNLLPTKEAFSRFLLSAKCFVAEDLPLYLYNTACFDSAQLVYFPGNGGVKLPSWKLEGAFSMAGGSDEDSVRGAIYISAVA